MSVASPESKSLAPSSSSASVSSTASSLPFSHLFVRPSKQVHSFSDIARWQRSAAWHEFVAFVLVLNESVKSKPNSVQRAISPNVQTLVNYLQNMKRWIGEIPPVQQPMRFGNKAFRDWHARMMQESPRFLNGLLSPSYVENGAVAELMAYMAESFGNLQRIDYGTGHELNFVVWLCCLYKLGVFTADDHVALVLDVFRSYLELMRALQSTYWLEPAGSKGVWGLDDYQFLPFIWGSAQLIGDESIIPSHITSAVTVDRCADDYIFMSCIQFILKMKRGPFAEHSPMLHDISDVPRWEKVNAGLIKMYHDEVLNQFPVIQHFYFGSIMSFNVYDDPRGIQALQNQHRAPKSREQ